MDNVKIVRLQSGEDVIAQCNEIEGTGEFSLIEPMTILFKRLPSGKAFMMMSPWLPLELIEDNHSLIFASDILTMVKPKKAIIDYYARIVGEITLESILNAKDIEESLSNMDEETEYHEDGDISDEESIEDIMESFGTNVNKKSLLH
jgi:hypothetical protein